MDSTSKHTPLPDRCNGYTQRAVIGGCVVVLSTEEYSDGSLGAFTVELSKTTVEVIQPIRTLCHAVSLGLQYGVPLEVYVDEFLFTSGGRYVGEVSGNDAIDSTSSIVDYIFRELAISYLGRTDLANSDADGVAFELSEEHPLSFVSYGFLRGYASEATFNALTEIGKKL